MAFDDDDDDDDATTATGTNISKRSDCPHTSPAVVLRNHLQHQHHLPLLHDNMAADLQPPCPAHVDPPHANPYAPLHSPAASNSALPQHHHHTTLPQFQPPLFIANSFSIRFLTFPRQRWSYTPPLSSSVRPPILTTFLLLLLLHLHTILGAPAATVQHFPDVFDCNVGGPPVPGFGPDPIQDIVGTTTYVRALQDFQSPADADWQQRTQHLAGRPALDTYRAAVGSGFGYNLSVLNSGIYTCNLLFAELQLNASGQRVFTATVNDQTVDNVDVYAAAGKYNPLLLPFHGLLVVNGYISILLSPRIGDPMLSAFQCARLAPPPSSPDTTTPVLPNINVSMTEDVMPTAEPTLEISTSLPSSTSTTAASTSSASRTASFASESSSSSVSGDSSFTIATATTPVTMMWTNPSAVMATTSVGLSTEVPQMTKSFATTSEVFLSNMIVPEVTTLLPSVTTALGATTVVPSTTIALETVTITPSTIASQEATAIIPSTSLSSGRTNAVPATYVVPQQSSVVPSGTVVPETTSIVMSTYATMERTTVIPLASITTSMIASTTKTAMDHAPTIMTSTPMTFATASSVIAFMTTPYATQEAPTTTQSIPYSASTVARTSTSTAVSTSTTTSSLIVASSLIFTPLATTDPIPTLEQNQFFQNFSLNCTMLRGIPFTSSLKAIMVEKIARGSGIVVASWALTSFSTSSDYAISGRAVLVPLVVRATSGESLLINMGAAISKDVGKQSFDRTVAYVNSGQYTTDIQDAAGNRAVHSISFAVRPMLSSEVVPAAGSGAGPHPINSGTISGIVLGSIALLTIASLLAVAAVRRARADQIDPEAFDAPPPILRDSDVDSEIGDVRLNRTGHSLEYIDDPDSTFTAATSHADHRRDSGSSLELDKDVWGRRTGSDY